MRCGFLIFLAGMGKLRAAEAKVKPPSNETGTSEFAKRCPKSAEAVWYNHSGQKIEQI